MGALFAWVGGAWVPVGGEGAFPPVPPAQVGAVAPASPTSGMLWWDTADTSVDNGVDVDGGSPASSSLDTIDCGPP